MNADRLLAARIGEPADESAYAVDGDVDGLIEGNIEAKQVACAQVGEVP